MSLSHISWAFNAFFSHNAVHSVGPRARYSTDLLARLLGTVSQILWRVVRSCGNLTCICQGKHFLPCVALGERRALRSDRRPRAAIMEKQSRTHRAVETKVLTALARITTIVFVYLLQYNCHINLCATFFAIVIVYFL